MKWYQFDIRNLSDAEYQKWYSLMNEKRQVRVDRFRFADDKKRTVAGEMLARRAIAEWGSVSAESIRFRRTEHGKPFAIGLPVEFNISHSVNTVVCAVSDSPVGIDVEVIRPIDLNIAKRICTDDDLEHLFGHTPGDEDFVETNDHELLIRFFKIWTAKEAYFKCVGTGITDLKHLNYAYIFEKQSCQQVVQDPVVITIIQKYGNQ